MTDVYSPLLGAALALTIGSLVCLISSRVSASRHLVVLTRIGTGLTFAALAIAVSSHVALGHQPGTPQALSPWAFVTEHPMVFLLALVAATLWTFSLPRGSERRSPS